MKKYVTHRDVQEVLRVNSGVSLFLVQIKLKFLEIKNPECQFLRVNSRRENVSEFLLFLVDGFSRF